MISGVLSLSMPISFQTSKSKPLFLKIFQKKKKKTKLKVENLLKGKNQEKQC